MGRLDNRLLYPIWVYLGLGHETDSVLPLWMGAHIPLFPELSDLVIVRIPDD
jgi:hypothetical protein